MSLTLALQTLQSQVVAAIATAGITAPAQVVVGWPVGPELVKMLGQTQDETEYLASPTTEYLISLWPLGGAKDVSRYGLQTHFLAPPTVTLSASVTNGVVTFSGTPAGALNVWTFVSPLLPGALYQTSTSDTLASIAAGCAAAVNALGYPGVSATASGNGFTVAGATYGAARVKVNVGGSTTSGAAYTELSRNAQMVQVNAWCPDPNLRGQVHDAIIANVGTRDRVFVPMPNGTATMIEFSTASYDDAAQSAYSAYISRVVFRLEYAVSRVTSATQIGELIAGQSVNGGASVVQDTGG